MDRIKRITKLRKHLEFDRFYKDEDVQILRLLLKRLKDKYRSTTTEILNVSQEEVLIPSTIFSKKLSPLETDVKYLKENLNFDYSKISKLLGRERKTVWQTYKNAAKKFPEPLEVQETEYSIPVSAFTSDPDFSILEAAVVYLKEKYELSYHDIGELLKRNEKTIWTVFSRAQKKRKV